MPPPPAAFAIPGDITTITGGYIYERRLLEGLRAQGRRVDHLELPPSFPDPSAEDMARAVTAMAAVPADLPLIVDGLVFGAVDPAGLARVRAPIVAMIHHPLALESGLPPARARLLRARETANCALAAHVVVPSAHTARVLVAEYGVAAGRISVACPGIAQPAGTARPVDPPLILSVGIQHPRKGHDVLIAALAGLTDLPWKAVIAGSAYDAAHAAALAGQVADGGLGARVRLAGLVPEKALSQLWRAASVFALATRYEGYGIVFAEALAHGLPIVGCRVGAVPDTVPEGTGLLVPAEDPQAFGAALRRLLTEAPLRAALSAASAEAGAQLPGWADTAAIMGAVLDDLAAARRL